MALEKRFRVLIWAGVLVNAAVVIVIVLPLAGLVAVPPWETLRLIHVPGLIAAIAGDGILLLAIARGWIAVGRTRKRTFGQFVCEWFASRWFVRVVHEFLFSLWRPLIGDLLLAFRPGRYGVGLWGLAIAGLVCVITVACWPGTISLGEEIGVGLAIAGLMFGILGYHVAFRVEKSIRTVVTDGRQFVKEVSDILAREIICDHSKVKAFSEASDAESARPDYADLICLLWFPYYGLTRDFNHVGEAITRQLSRIQELACRTYFITAANPLTLMEHYATKYYKPSAIKYDPDALAKVANAIRGKPPDLWLSELAGIHELNWEEYKVDKVKHCISFLLKIISSAPRYWTVKTINNKKLMNGLVQLVWTRRKAVIVFLPPEKITPARRAIQKPAPESAQLRSLAGQKVLGEEEDDTRRKAKALDAGTSFRCSGFVTEDPYMIDMIHEIMRIRFGIP